MERPRFTPGQRAFLVTEAARMQHITQWLLTVQSKACKQNCFNKKLVSFFEYQHIAAVGTKQFWLHHNHCPYYVINRVISNKYGIKIIGKSYSTKSCHILLYVLSKVVILNIWKVLRFYWLTLYRNQSTCIHITHTKQWLQRSIARISYPNLHNYIEVYNT